ncbi:MAG: YidC/Oxa1 family membrane protein insertase [Patescibacteria group bacterium]
MIELFNTILVFPLVNVLIAIYKLLLILHIPFPLGFSIIGLTILIRFVLYPLTASQLKASKKMQEIAPHVSRLKDKHKNDAKTLQQETMKLYKEFGVNPAAGCLPVLVQIPVIWGLYSVLDRVVKLGSGNAIGEINKMIYFDFLKISGSWSTDFFGISLGAKPSDLIKVMPLIILVPVLTGVFQFIQSKMMVPQKKQEAKKDKKNLPAVKEEKKKDDFATVFQSQSLFIFPIMIGFFSYGFPIGLSLYWNTFSIFGIIQQHRVSGWGGLKDLWEKKKK